MGMRLVRAAAVENADGYDRNLSAAQEAQITPQNEVLVVEAPARRTSIEARRVSAEIQPQNAEVQKE